MPPGDEDSMTSHGYYHLQGKLDIALKLIEENENSFWINGFISIKQTNQQKEKKEREREEREKIAVHL